MIHSIILFTYSKSFLDGETIKFPDNWESILLPDILLQALITKEPNETAQEEWLSDLHSQGYTVVRLTNYGYCIRAEGSK